MPVRKHIITGPDIDKLAQGLYGPEVERLANELKRAQASNTSLRRELRQAKKTLRAATNQAEALRNDLATSRATRQKFVRENVRLKARLLNAGITIQEEA